MASVLGDSKIAFALVDLGVPRQEGRDKKGGDGGLTQLHAHCAKRQECSYERDGTKWETMGVNGSLPESVSDLNAYGKGYLYIMYSPQPKRNDASFTVLIGAQSHRWKKPCLLLGHQWQSTDCIDETETDARGLRKTCRKAIHQVIPTERAKCARDG